MVGLSDKPVNALVGQGDEKRGRKRVRSVLSSHADLVVPQRIEGSVSRISQARNDVFAGVEGVIDGAGMDLDVGVPMSHDFDTLGRGDERHDGDPRDSPGLEAVDHHAQGASRGQHGIQDQGGINRSLVRQFVVIMDRLGRRFISKNPEVPDLGIGNQVQERIDHHQSGSQNRDQADSFCQDSAIRFHDWSLDPLLPRPQLLSCVKCEQGGQ